MRLTVKVTASLCLLAALLLLDDCVEGRRSGGRSGSSGGGWFSRKSSSRRTSSSQSSYPKQQWGSSGGSAGSGYPKQQFGGGTGTAGLGSNTRQTAGGTAIGGGGFVNPSGNRATNYGSNYGRGGGYSGYGTYSSGMGGGGYSYRSPGYGTNYGTNFAGGIGRYGGGMGFRRKSLGLGVGAGFLGGAAVGAMGGIAAVSVYHRYQEYKRMMYMHRYGGHYNDPYYNNYYSRGVCMGGCPFNAHCEYGFCECNNGYEKSYGQCYRYGERPRGGRGSNFDPFVSCGATEQCLQLDLNLVCNLNLTTGQQLVAGEQGGRCECRTDMRWNSETGQCQLYLDVDCSAITYDTKPPPIILAAVNDTLERVAENSEEMEIPENATTVTIDQSLSNSLLSSIDPEEASEAEIREAFCRDVDSFSFELDREPGGSDTDSTVSGSLAGLLVFLVLLVCTCCICARCVKQRMNAARERAREFAVIGGGAALAAGVGEGDIIANPNYQAQATPMHYPPGGGPQAPGPQMAMYPPLPPNETSFQQEGPQAIPPTQPGYTNYAPPAAPYPPPPGDQLGAPYPPQPLPYPSQPPAAGGPFYPPAAPGGPYPPAQQPYSPYPSQPVPPPYNPL